MSPTGCPGFSGPPLQVQQYPQLVHGRSESVPQVLIPRPATPVSVSLLNPLILIDTALQVPVIQSRSRSRINLAGMLNSPDQSMQHLPSTNTPGAIPALIAVQHLMSSAFIPPRSTVLWLWVYVGRTGLDSQLRSAATSYPISLYCWSGYPE